MKAHLWKGRLATPPQHEWFEAFEANPQEALDALLRRRFDLVNLGIVDVEELLSSWVLRIGNDAGFAARVDSTLAVWMEEYWGIDNRSSPDTLRSIWATVGRLLCVSYVPANERYFDKAASTLRTLLLTQPGFAPVLFSPRGCDAFYTCANAVALYQRDDQLRNFWWQLAALPNGFPSRYAGTALTGIRRLRVPHGGFRFDFGRALFVAANSLSRLVRSDVMTGNDAVDEFSYLYERARGAFPSFDQAWAVVFQSAWRPESRKGYCAEIADFVERELRRLTPRSHLPSGATSDLRSIALSTLRPTWDISEAPKQVEQKLRTSESGRIAAANHLLSEQRDYGLKTGNITFLVRSLQKFAVAVRDTAPNDQDLSVAQKWIVERTERDPDDPRGWNLLVNILKRRDEMQGTAMRAWRLAWALVDRFPGDTYCRNGLAEVLKSQGRLNEAEEVYRQAVEDFPHDVVARNGLGGVLKSQGRLNEAEEVYRQAVEEFPHDVITRNGLGDVLKLQGRLNEAEEVYRQAVEKDFPHDVVARNGLAYILARIAAQSPNEAERAFAEAEALYESVLAVRPDRKSVLIASCGLGWVCERSARLEDARTWYSKALALDSRNVWAIDGLSRVNRSLDAATVGVIPTHEAIALNVPDLRVEMERHESPPPLSWTQYVDSEAELADQRYQTAADAIPAERAVVRQSQGEVGNRLQSAVHWSVVGYQLRLARAAFFRRSARWQESLPVGRRTMAPAKLRSAARKLLAEVAALRPNDSRVNAELLSLDLEGESHFSHPVSSEGLSIVPKAPTAELLQVAAHAARIKSRREHYSFHDASHREEVFGSIDRLRLFDPAAKPVCYLEEGLGALAMVDSDERLQMAAGSLEKLKRWVSPKAQRVRDALDTAKERDLGALAPFDAWAYTLTQRLFKPCGLTEVTDASISIDQVRRVDEWLQDSTNQWGIADLEYQFARLLTPAIEEALALA